jgi:hypothetical protein
MTRVIIGDIHGHADKLKLLLEHLGYESVGGLYRPGPDLDGEQHELIFLGDLIDRGPHNREVVTIVKALVDNGHARAIMGNHEFNAICYHTAHAITGEPLRARTEKNQRQHQAFLDDYPLGGDETRSVIDWFKTLPLFLELDNTASLAVYDLDADDEQPAQEQFSNRVRFVHACWDEQEIEFLNTRLGYPALLDDQFIQEAATRGTEAFNAVEIVLKGPEIPLPGGGHFVDKEGNERHNIRYNWWRGGTTYKDVALVPSEQQSLITDDVLPDTISIASYPVDAPPVFFGHYWMTGDPQAQRHNVACLDYSIGKGGPLTAYILYGGSSRLGAGRLRGDQFLTTAEFGQQPPGEFTYSLEQRLLAWEVARDNAVALASDTCGCFYCQSVFETAEITVEDGWILCPRCGVDYVIGSASGLPLTRRFLAEVKSHWLDGAGTDAG